MGNLISKMYKGHKNIYNQSYLEREIQTEIYVPQFGTNEDTGILLLVPGYGANLNSHVWKRMRNEFSDQYNLITIQCDYFGIKFMDSNIPEELITIANNKNISSATILYDNPLDETLDEFNDMGIMQALDLVTVTLNTIYDLKNLGYIFNIGKTIIFGSSHGCYLAHLANIICPNLYTYIFDISAYIYPFYLENTRSLYHKVDNINIHARFTYFLTKYPEYRYHKSLYDLNFLYNFIENSCKIIIFQGVNDTMVPASQKIEFFEKVKNTEIMLITEEDVDGTLFKNANHGLGLDFFVFFEMLMPMVKDSFEKKFDLELSENIIIGNADVYFEISYKTGFPELIHYTK